MPSDHPRPLPRALAATVDHEIVVKRSRFLASVVPARSSAEAEAVVAARRREHWGARHHCVAVVLGPHGEARRSSDDGEPSGTAGTPMLDVLRHRDVTDVVAVVTRYFGGVLLGTGGLVRAYAGAVAGALDEADGRGLLRVRRHLTEVGVTVSHADAGRVEHLLREWASRHDAVLSPTTYAELARLELLVDAGDLEELRTEVAAASAGTLRVDVGAVRVVTTTPRTP
ncbi:IMPACT family protein [Isoptericola jiangsuensis]|uniref:IMPACT family protein n=1 Tax=Isoptericola jiangsuensis TaxID=548579 RepID=UPI003AACBB4F